MKIFCGVSFFFRSFISRNHFAFKYMTAVFAIFLFCHCSYAAAAVNNFIPQQPILKIEKVKPGMKGHALTVLQGRKISSVPLEVISVIPSKGTPRNLILVKVPSGVAAGMSGSPVFFDGKLAGAIGYGFVNSDHTLGMLTPIEEMMSVLSWPNKKIELPKGIAPLNAPIILSGAGQNTADELKKALGTDIQLSAAGMPDYLPIEDKAKLSPGEAVMVFLAWGDVQLGATGTLTATSKDGRFIAFAHPFMELGAVDFPIGRAMVHYIVPNNQFPFKIASPVSFVGSVTQDRPQGIGGSIGSFPLSVSSSLTFKDNDTDRTFRKGFNIVTAPFLTSKMVSAMYTGLIKDLWGRNGHGMLSATFSVDGRGMARTWRRSNLFFSDAGAPDAASKEISAIIEIFLLNAFKNIYPIGFSLSVEASEEPRLLFIEGIKFDKDSVVPGDELQVTVKLRPWRKAPQERIFDLVVPDKSFGMCEVVVRGGGVDSAQSLAVLEGWKAIDSFNRMLTELDAIETNNELIVEFTSQPTQEKVNLPPDEYLSESREKKLKDGSMKIYRSEFVVEGLMRKQIEVRQDEKGN